MTKIKFQGFPVGSSVSITAIQAGTTVGPVSRSAWKQTTPPPSGEADFKVYSMWGSGDPGPRGGFELLDGAMIEMPEPGNLSVYYDDVSGFSTTDIRRLFFETDYGERYDAQFLTHSHLPAGFTTMDPTGPTLGKYPGFVSGHVHKGKDMQGNQVLHKDYEGGPGLIGTMDIPVTFFVSDGLVSKTKTITVRLVDAWRYYQNTSGLTYGVAARTPEHLRGDYGKRRGIIYVSRGTDFSDVDTSGGNVWTYTLPDGILDDQAFNLGSTKQLTKWGVPRTDFEWPWYNENTMCICLKGGETFYIQQGGLETTRLGWHNSQLRSYNGRAIISGENNSGWAPNPGGTLGDSRSFYSSHRFVDIDFNVSDYDVSDPTWREWWNELYYTGKTGTITENSQDNVAANPYNGDKLTNGNGVWTQVVRDDDNGDGTGKLIVRQVVDRSNVDDINAQPAAFTDGDTLTNQSATASLTFVAAGSRQDRTRRVPPTMFGFTGAQSNTGPMGMVWSGITISGAEQAVSYFPRWMIMSDVLIKNYWNYGIFGDARNLVQNAVVIAQPSNYEGVNRDLNNGISPNRQALNTIKTGEPTLTATNDISHAAQRYGAISSWAAYKCGQWAYGGHGALQQPGLRCATNGASFNQQQVYHHGCFYAGGLTIMQVSSPDDWDHTVPRTPRGWVMDTCWFRGIYNTGSYFLSLYTNMAFKNCRIGTPAGVELSQEAKTLMQNAAFYFIEFKDQNKFPWLSSPDSADTLPSFVENCLFEFKPVTVTTANILDLDTDIRGIPITYSGNTFDIDETKVASVPATWDQTP